MHIDEGGTLDADLGPLADPSAMHAPIELRSGQIGLSELIQMLRVRIAEEIIGESVTQGQVKCPCHLSIGQEAIPVGIAKNLDASDRVFGGHRSHGHFIAQGGGIQSLFAEVLGRDTGCSRGMGGSMHLIDLAHGFIGSVPIVGGTIAMAVGAGLAAQKDKGTAVAVAYFGDGSVEEGAFHESMNFAAAYQVPVLFVCENNLFSSHLHISQRQPASSVARFAVAHRMRCATIDGNDVDLVFRTSRSLIEAIRLRSGPAFLEAVTYRWRGHVGPREDVDVGVQRKSDLALWKRRDPVGRLRHALELSGRLHGGEFDTIESKLRQEIRQEWEKALLAPYPDECALIDRVYVHPERELL